MKKLRKIIAMVMVMAMVMGMGMGMTVSAGNNFDGNNPANSTADVTVEKLQESTTSVSAYKFISASYANGVVTYSLESWAKEVLEASDIASIKTNGTVDVDKVIEALGGKAGTSSENVVASGQVTDTTARDNKDATGILAALASADKSGVTPSTVSAPQSVTNSWTATFTNLKVGSYLVLAEDSTLVYNPMLVSVGLTANSDTGKITGVRPNGAVAKYSDIPFDKVITSEDGSEAKGGDLQVGDTITYKITGTIPNYDTKLYTNITYKIVDTLDAGLTPPNANAVTVKINGTDVSGRVTVSGQVITIDLSSIAGDHTGQAVEITYTATLNASATTGFDANKNSATLTFSQSPTATSNADKTTYTYTFSIDGSILGNESGHELTKTGVNEWTETEGNMTEYQPLAGAMFTLYSDENCTNKVSAISGNPTTTDASGNITFNGLDGGKNYWLKETKAPDGYSINDTKYKITFVPYYNEDGTMSKYEVKIDDEIVVTYTYQAGESNENATITTMYATKTTSNNATGNLETTEIKNTKLASLPSTGGIGTTIFTIGGIVIMVAAAALYFANRKKKS